MSFGMFCDLGSLALLMLASFGCIYLEFWKPRCAEPFVEIGNKCYFFSTNKAPTYEYYQVPYKGHVFSVPAMLDWLHAVFACETLDPNARLLTVESADDLRYLANYFARLAHPATHPFFWSGGHRGVLANEQLQLSSAHHFYWHQDQRPMNISHIAKRLSNSSRFPSGLCVYVEYHSAEMLLATASCDQQMAYACEIAPGPRSLSVIWQ